MRVHAGGDQQLRIAIFGQNGAVGLLGQFSRFKGQRASTDFDLYLMRSFLRHNFDSFRRIVMRLLVQLLT